MKIQSIVFMLVTSLFLLSWFPIKISSVENDIPMASTNTTETTLVTEPIIISRPSRPEFKLNDKIQYQEIKNEELLLEEIEKCNNYISELQKHILYYPVQINIELERVYEILEQYKQDLEFLHKTLIEVPKTYHYKDFKSYESYNAITAKNSPHYRLQHVYAYTGSEGIRKVENRYCIALGSYFTSTIGQYVDIVLANGTIIPCILGDQKSDKHTDSNHIAHKTDGSIVEFIVDLEKLDPLARRMGNISYVYDEWQSPVIRIIVYDINYMDEDYKNNIFWHD